MSFDIVYSPDDGGWYAEEYTSDRTTAVYATRREALDAARREVWEESVVTS
jgi:hypothetical protein